MSTYSAPPSPAATKASPPRVFSLNDHWLKHNVQARGKAAWYLVTAAVMWWLSWWVAWIIAYALISSWSGMFTASRIDPGGWATITAWAFMVLLLIDGVRKGREEFDLSRLYDTYIVQGATGTEGEALARSYLAYEHGFADPVQVGWMIAQAMLAAPRWSVSCLLAWKSIVPVNTTQLVAARAIMQKLLTHRGWMPIEEVRKHPVALMQLNRLDLLSHRMEGGELQVRVPAHITQHYDQIT